VSGSKPARRDHAAAADYLRELLLQPGRYRQRWVQYAERTRAGEINQLAVADVLAHYLWHHPRNPGDLDVLPRQLKDTVLRVISGKVLSKSALTLFIDAFGFTDSEAALLWKLWEGSDRVRFLSGPRAMPPEKAAAFGPPQYQTLSLHDHHYIGPDGLPIRHRTLQIIEATVSGLDRIPYRADTNAVSVEVGHGFKGLSGPFYQITEGVYGLEMVLAKSLAVGETLTLEYWTSFNYREPPEREFRRVVLGRMEGVDIRVEFDPAKLPASVWWAVWDGIDGGIVDQDQAALDSQRSVHRYLKTTEDTVVGFHWDW
jgi:hypothetical protein